MKMFTLVPIVAALLCATVVAAEKTPAVATVGSNTTQTPELFRNGGMFDLYAENRARAIPNLITPDFLLLGYSQLRQARIADTEEKILQPGFERLLQQLMLDLNSSADDKPASDSRAFVALLQALLDGDPTALPEPYQQEYSLVTQGAGVEQSAIAVPLGYSGRHH